MHQKLIIKAFNKKKEITKEETGITLSKNRTAQKLSEYLLDDYGLQFGDMSLRNLYNSATKNKATEIKQSKVVNALCNYLGYDSFEKFLIDYPSEKPKNGTETLIHSVKKHKTKLSISVVTLLFAIIMYNALNKQLWMVWDKNEYIEVNYNIEKDKAGILQPYDKNLIKYFRKIPYTSLKSCEIPFFDKSGNPAVWYYKNKKELELFTQAGKHPENGETLKKITPYMIRKYICEEY